MTSVDAPVQIYDRDETVIGQPQSKVQAPHDGATLVREVVVHTDVVIKDPNDPLAVQIPKDSGASTYGAVSPLGAALKRGNAEAQFAAAREQASKDAAAGPGADRSVVEAAKEAVAPGTPVVSAS